MSGDRWNVPVRHLSEDNLDWLLSEADNPNAVRRLLFLKNLYPGDRLDEAVDCVGNSEPTSTHASVPIK